MRDTYGRMIDYMRVSITDRCNLRCRYCMPDGIPQVPMSDILTYEELECVCRAAAEIGIEKIKITGGEPLVRLGCADLIGKIKRIPGIRQVTMTTNGVLLAKHLPELVASGLDAVNISLDTLKPGLYQEITGRDELPEVLRSIDRAVGSGLVVKINCVLQRGSNDGEWRELAELTLDKPLDVRFIEMMPIGSGKEFEPVCNDDIIKKLKARYPELAADSRIHGNGPAIYYQIPGAQGSVGFISAVHGKFCDGCNRIRLTSQGKLKPCLCYGEEVDVRGILRSGMEGTDPHRQEEMRERLRDALVRAVEQKPKSHRFDTGDEITERKKMVQIGG